MKKRKETIAERLANTKKTIFEDNLCPKCGSAWWPCACGTVRVTRSK